jgi:hypothetical protein
MYVFTIHLYGVARRFIFFVVKFYVVMWLCEGDFHGSIWASRYNQARFDRLDHAVAGRERLVATDIIRKELRCCMMPLFYREFHSQGFQHSKQRFECRISFG